MSVTQWIWETSLNLGSFSPIQYSTKKTPTFGSDAFCWLCSGDTKHEGWPLREIVGAAFTDSNSAKCVDSSTICQSCAALMKKEAWEMACNKFGHSPFFPVKDGKKPFMSNWMFSSHVFAKGVWQQPSRKEAREVLLCPPDPPFVMSFAQVGKKHVLFRAKVSHSTDHFFVQLDEQSILVRGARFRELLDIFEEGYKLGFSKESLLTGNYNQAAIMKVGLGAWRKVESRLKTFRMSDGDLLCLVSFVAVR